MSHLTHRNNGYCFYGGLITYYNTVIINFIRTRSKDTTRVRYTIREMIRVIVYKEVNKESYHVY